MKRRMSLFAALVAALTLTLTSCRTRPTTPRADRTKETALYTAKQGGEIPEDVVTAIREFHHYLFVFSRDTSSYRFWLQKAVKVGDESVKRFVQDIEASGFMEALAATPKPFYSFIRIDSINNLHWDNQLICHTYFTQSFMDAMTGEIESQRRMSTLCRLKAVPSSEANPAGIEFQQFDIESVEDMPFHTVQM